jgi:uncharacterized protein (TIGR04255 family)
LETQAYTDFTDFATRWDAVLKVVTDELGVTRQDRIGLRYVNEFPCDPNPTPEAIRSIVREELAGAVGAHERTQRLISSMQESRFAQETGVCTLRHGLISRDDLAAYVLDLDFYDDAPVDFNPDAQIRELAAFNHGAFEVFRWAIPPELFESFDPQEREGD